MLHVQQGDIVLVNLDIQYSEYKVAIYFVFDINYFRFCKKLIGLH